MPDQSGSPHGRWLARGLLGWINMAEALVEDGCVPSEESRKDMDGVYVRLGRLLDRLDGHPRQGEAGTAGEGHVNMPAAQGTPADATGRRAPRGR